MHADTVTIHRLKISAPAAMQVRLRRELAAADWPTDEAWVFIRRLQVRAPSTRIAKVLLTQAHEQLHGSGDNVVRFASLAQLLAALLRDRLRGEAGKHWYWQRWAHLFALPLPRAIASLFAENAETLLSLCARLAEINQLLPVWLALDSEAANQLANELAWRSGFSLPTIAQRQAALRALEMSEEHTRLKIPSALHARWSPIVRETTLDNARRQLAFLLIAQEYAPLRLRQAPAALLAELQSVFNSEAERTIQRTARSPVDADRSEPTAKHKRAHDPAEHLSPQSPLSQDRLASARSDALEAETSPHAETEIKAQPDSKFAAQHAFKAIETHEPPFLNLDKKPSQHDRELNKPRPATVLLRVTATQLPPPEITEADTAAPTIQPFDRLRSEQGGLLYLLNTLNRPEAQSLMGDYWRELPSGWAWLYRLGQTLNLDENDALTERLAAELGLDNTRQLADLPPLPVAERWQQLLQRWYGASGVWTPELLNLSAEIAFSPSHIDLYAPMSAVRLPVRLAGLDINPGWLPWLGRVVSFHYGSQP